MSRHKKSGSYCRTVVLALVWGCSVSALQAEENVADQAYSDEQISVWANNASLELFVSQLPGMTERRISIASDLEIRVSGRFNGSMVDALNALSEQHQMLFDLDENMLSVVAESAREKATVPLTGSSIEEVLQRSSTIGKLRGNEVKPRDGEVLISGHPEFVRRVAKLVATSVADARPEDNTHQISDDRGVVDPVDQDLASTKALVPVEPLSGLLSESDTGSAPELVTDAAASVLVEQASEVSSTDDAVDITASRPREIRWVTDIPGFDTF